MKTELDLLETELDLVETELDPVFRLGADEYHVVENYNAASDTEVTLTMRTIVTVLEKADGWWFAKTSQGKEGWCVTLLFGLGLKPPLLFDAMPSLCLLSLRLWSVYNSWPFPSRAPANYLSKKPEP